MKEKIKEFEKWKKKAIKEIKEVSLTRHIAFDELLNNLFDLAFLNGKTVGMESSVEKIREKIKTLEQ